MRKLPNFFILGVQKCGTTSLAEYCARHNDIYVPKIKEVGFFDDPKKIACGMRELKKYYAHCKTKLYRCDATPTYFSNYQTAIPTIRSVYYDVEQLKFAIILRDPVERFVSHYIHNFSRGTEVRDINEIAKQELGLYKNKLCVNKLQYLGPGFYSELVRIWQREFNASQFVFLSSKALLNSRSQELDKLWRFLGVPSVSNIAEIRKNVSGTVRSHMIGKWASDENALGKALVRILIPSDWRNILRQFVLEKNTSSQREIPKVQDEILCQVRDVYSESVELMDKLIRL